MGATDYLQKPVRASDLILVTERTRARRDLLAENRRLRDEVMVFEACKTLGYRVEQFPVNLKGCRGSGMCNLGCPNAAKQGTNRVQLPAAGAEGSASPESPDWQWRQSCGPFAGGSPGCLPGPAPG